jgi:hypothetical protein
LLLGCIRRFQYKTAKPAFANPDSRQKAAKLGQPTAAKKIARRMLTGAPKALVTK